MLPILAAQTLIQPLQGNRMPSKFSPTASMVDAAKKVFMAMACEQLIEPIVLGYQREVLAKGQWQIAVERRAALDRRTPEGENFPAVVLEPNHSYLLSEGDFASYMSASDKARIASGLNSSEQGNCPLLEAQETLRLAKQLLINEMQPVTKLSFEQLASGKVEDFKRYVELTLKLLAPYVQTPTLRASETLA